MKLIRRYILKEFAGPFALSLVVLTFVLLMGNIVKLAELVINKGVNIIDVGKLLLFLIPYLLSYTLPMSILTGLLLAMGRLSHDNEVTAIRACGVSLSRIMYPILMVGLIFSLFGVNLNSEILPHAHFASRQTLKEIGLKKPAAYLEPGTFIKTFQNYIIWIHSIRGNKLRHIRIYEPQEEDRPTRTIIAQKGEFIPSPEGNSIVLKLVNGTSDEPNRKDPSAYYKLNFNTYYLTLDMSGEEDRSLLEKKPKDMTLSELRHELGELKNGSGAEGADERRHMVTVYTTEVHQKISLGFACLAVVFIGFPLGVVTRREERSINFLVSLGVMAAYYVLLAMGKGLAQEEGLPPALCMWFPNILLVTIGLVLTRKTVAQ
ncbi:MAG: LptF/LptG family permease [Candidatus Omnitrophica bacterium]|nr:LptF/LptG family permease [Candidatus Omnitrophota bacterium]